MSEDIDGFNYPAATRQFVPQVITRIAGVDEMFSGDLKQYFQCGASGLNCVLAAVQLANLPEPGRILDFGCGAGRVTRWLRAAYPQVQIHGCEIDRLQSALQFVHETFAVSTWNSVADLARLEPPATYDLIWLGSVFTHLSQHASAQLFDKLSSWLNSRGMVVFTTHGRRALFHDRHDPDLYGLSPAGRARALEEHRCTGYGYADYSWAGEYQTNYGISFTSTEWWTNFVKSRREMKLVYVSEAAFDEHQDVVAAMKAPAINHGNPIETTGYW
jgi:cyclopropane fatty-acyl-phospholipid synthase-like methyltransferase